MDTFGTLEKNTDFTQLFLDNIMYVYHKNG